MDRPKRNQKNRPAPECPTLAKLFCIVVLASTVSCATPLRNIQPQINSLASAQRYEKALALLDNPSVYGARNQLLFWLDKGLLAHYAGHPNDSIAAFTQADKKFEEAYTRSMTQMASSWAVNDYREDYRGEDHEYILVSLFQALNFASLGKLDEALVEARRADAKLRQVGSRYKDGQKNVYSDDAFAHFLSGLLWQATGTPEGFNDAYIAYSRAMALYPSPPSLLKSHWEAMKKFMEKGALPPSDLAEVYVFEYIGDGPIKVSAGLPVPLDGSHVTRISFPAYAQRYGEVASSLVAATHGQQEYFKETEVAENIGDIAVQVLNARRAWLLARAGLRPGLKYAAAKAAEAEVARNFGDVPAQIFNVLGNVYNLATEEADVRGWQTLPNDIRIGCLTLQPGTYEIMIEDFDAHQGLLEKRRLGTITLKAGDKKFLVSRGGR